MPNLAPSSFPKGITQSPLLKFGSIAALLIAAFFAGRVSISESSTNDANKDNYRVRDKYHHSIGSDSNRQRHNSNEKNKRRLSILMTQALAEPDATKRYGSSWAIIEKISHDNWHEILESFHATARKKGYIDHGMYNEALKRVGQVVGREAVDFYTEKEEPIRGPIIYGWGMSEPDEALAWANALRPDQNRLSHIRSAIAGAARLQHEKGKQLMEALPEKEWKYCCGLFVWNTVYGPGIDNAEAWATQQTDESRKTAALGAVHDMVSKSAKLGRPPEKLAAWIVSTDDGSATAINRKHALIRDTLNSHPENGAELIYQLTTQGIADINTMTSIMQGCLSEKNAAQLLQWAQETSNRELGDAMEQSLTHWQQSQTNTTSRK